MKKIATFLLIFFITACDELPKQSASDIQIFNARIVLNPVPGRPAAIYMDILNAGTGDDRLRGLKALEGQTLALHQSVEEEGIMRMRAVDALLVPAGQTVSLAPGGYHGMAMTPTFEASPVVLLLDFEKAGPIEVEAVLRKLGD